MLVIGHRGAMGYAPENTLLSFQKALELAVPMVELDVYTCRTGELVVIHDHTLERTTNGAGFVWEKSLTELQALDAGSGEVIPTLPQVLKLLDRRCSVNIELKGAGTAAPLSKLLQSYLESGWQADDFLVSSFDHPELQRFHQQMPDIRIGALTCGIPIDYARFAQDLGAWSANLDKDFVTPEFVSDCHRRGLKCLVYTADSPLEIRRLHQMGVDGLFTNYPDRVMHLTHA